MPITARISGLNSTIRQVRSAVRSDVDRELRRRVLAGVRDVKLANPVDTGRSRNAWEFRQDGTIQVGDFTFNDYRIDNYTNYIQLLNEGRSPQAPAKFVESAFQRYFDDVVTIVYDDPRGDTV